MCLMYSNYLVINMNSLVIYMSVLSVATQLFVWYVFVIEHNNYYGTDAV